MQPDDKNRAPELDQAALEKHKQQSLYEKCSEIREKLNKREPETIARLAGLALEPAEKGSLWLVGNYLLDTCRISWPDLQITGGNLKPVSLELEALWLHYLERADGTTLTRRWVNLSEIGGLFYQQAFQGYSGDELAAYWQDDLERFKQACLAEGGWPVQGLGDLAFEWRVLPRLPLCICYRLTAAERGAWATILFDSSANHYVAADVAATVGKTLSDCLTGRKR